MSKINHLCIMYDQRSLADNLAPHPPPNLSSPRSPSGGAPQTTLLLNPCDNTTSLRCRHGHLLQVQEGASSSQEWPIISPFRSPIHILTVTVLPGASRTGSLVSTGGRRIELDQLLIHCADGPAIYSLAGTPAALLFSINSNHCGLAAASTMPSTGLGKTIT